MRDSPQLLDASVADFAHRLASGDPTPGGGSASALSGALGASLVGMVANLTLGRPAYAQHERAVEELLAGATRCRDELLSLIDLDAAAYDAVVGARRLPREAGDAERRRDAAIAAALVGATRVPLRIARASAEVLELAARLAQIGNANALSDVAVAADLSWTGLRGGLANVRANLPSLAADDPLRDEVAPALEELDQLAAHGTRSVESALAERRRA